MFNLLMGKLRKVLTVFVVSVFILMIGMSFYRAFIPVSSGSIARVSSGQDIIPHIRQEIFAGWNLMDWLRPSYANRSYFLGKYAGCAQNAPLRASDQEFTEMWLEDSEKYHMNYNDVVWYMRKRCPYHTPEEVERYFMEEYSYPHTTLEQRRDHIRSGNIFNAYRLKFINQEFTVLQQS